MKQRKSQEKGRRSGFILPLWKRIVFAIIATGIFFGLLEAVLWAIGLPPVFYEDDPYLGFASYSPLFVEAQDDAGNAIRRTAESKLKLFQPQEFPEVKPSRTTRIFCLGGSTTYGRPYTDATSFCGWLREILNEAEPSRSWEVINAGGVSYASYRVALLMEELIRYQPDLFVLYTGHNEFLERRTYREIVETPAMMRDLGMIASRTRTYVVVKQLIDLARAEQITRNRPAEILPEEVETLLENSVGPSDYQRNDEQQRRTIDHFRFNLNRIADIAESAGATLLLVVPASNLRESAPFKSEHRSGLSVEDLKQWRRFDRQAREMVGRDNLEARLAHLDKAIRIDERYADTHFQRARTLWQLERYSEAREAYVRARDEDVCPLRALTEMEEIAYQTAIRRRLPVVDFCRQTADLSEHGTPGRNLFLDHVHPTIEGHGRLAQAIHDRLREIGIVRPQEDWSAGGMERVGKRVQAKIDPEAHGKALRNMARLLRWAGKFEEGYYSAQLALESVPSDAQAHFLAGANALDLGFLSEAVEHLLTASRLDPNNSEIWFNLGKAYARDYLSIQATSAFKRALDLEPDFPQARNNLGNVYLAAGELDKAAKEYRYAITSDPDYAEAHHNLGLILSDHGKIEEARKQFERALELKPEYADAYNNLGSLKMRTGERDAASGLFRRALELEPHHFEAHMNLGEMHLAAGELRVAERLLRHAAALWPNHPDAQLNFGICLLTLGHADEAREILARATELEPTKWRAHFHLGNACFQEDALIEAAGHFNTAIRLNPQSSDVHHNLAVTLEALDLPDEAWKHYRQSLRFEPDWTVALQNAAWLGATHAELGAEEQNTAVTYAQRAVEITDHRDTRSYDILAAAYARQGEYRLAVAGAEAALILARQNEQADLAAAIARRLALYKQGKPFLRGR